VVAHARRQAQGAHQGIRWAGAPIAVRQDRPPCLGGRPRLRQCHGVLEGGPTDTSQMYL
jgi:hypothetical protein